jgi:glycosyltransferase involved in cell wall biosynthesis
MNLSVIIPAYNESRRISSTLTNYQDFFTGVYGDKFEIIVISDGHDDTGFIAKELSKKHPQIKLFEFHKRLGKGGAVARGYEQSTGDIVAYTDADGSLEPNDLHALIKSLEQSSYDGVIASRFLDNKVRYPLPRRILSRGFNLLTRVLFGLNYKDTQCGGKVFRSKVAKSIFSELYLTDWTFDVNLLYNARKHGFKIKEVPIPWTHNDDSKLKMSRTAFMMFLSLVRLRLLNSPFKFLIK